MGCIEFKRSCPISAYSFSYLHVCDQPIFFLNLRLSVFLLIFLRSIYIADITKIWILFQIFFCSSWWAYDPENEKGPPCFHFKKMLGNALSLALPFTHSLSPPCSFFLCFYLPFQFNSVTTLKSCLFVCFAFVFVCVGDVGVCVCVCVCLLFICLILPSDLVCAFLYCSFSCQTQNMWNNDNLHT